MSPIEQLRRSCKLKSYSLLFDGSHTYIGDNNVILTVTEEDTVAGHPKGQVHRVKLAGVDHKGWVVNGDARKCMRCKKKSFGMFTWKHHCRLCGDVVCGSCSNKSLNLNTVNHPLGKLEDGKSRVCKCCYKDHKEKQNHEKDNSNAMNDTGDNIWRDSVSNSDITTTTVSSIKTTPKSEKKAIGVHTDKENATNGILPPDTVAPALASSLASSFNSVASSIAASPIPDGLPVLANEQQAPTPNPKTKLSVTMARSPLASMSISSTTTNNNSNSGRPPLAPKSILKNKSTAAIIPAATAKQPTKENSYSPNTRAILNSLESEGQWDRDDDGISTPGSVLTPERATSHKKNLATTTPSSAAGGDKYFFTPSSHIKSTNGTNNKFIITTPLSPNSLLLANTKANQSSYSPESPNK